MPRRRRRVRVHGQQGEGAFEALAGKLHGFGQGSLGGIAAELVAEDVAEQCGGDLGVCFGGEFDALGQELLLQFREVFDDAVVDHGQASAVGQVRVGVPVGGAAVGCPAGVTDAGQGFRQGLCLKFTEEVSELARLLPGRNGAVGDNRHACRVVAAVLQTAQAFKDDIQGSVSGACRTGRITYITNDSTHGHKPNCSRRQRRWDVRRM